MAAGDELPPHPTTLLLHALRELVTDRGQSLPFPRRQSPLQKAIGKDVPIVELFKHTTVNELAQYLGQTPVKEEEEDRVVAINEGKNRLKRLLKKSGDEIE